MVKKNLDKKEFSNPLKSVKDKSMSSVEDDLKSQENKVEKITGEKISSKKLKDDSSEPGLFHYLVVLVVMSILFGAIYVGFEYYDNKYNSGVINNPNLNIKLYKYPFIVNDQEYSIQFYNPVSDLEKSDLQIGISKEELLSTKDFKFIFSTDSSSNGQVVKISGRLFPFLKNVYKFQLNSQDNIVSTNNLSCSDSTIDTKLIFFNSNATSNEVIYDNLTGCITFRTTTPDLLGTLGDKFFLEMINSK